MDGLITHADLHTPGRHVSDACLEIRDGRIFAIHEAADSPPDLPVLLDAEGRRTLPGFVDIHTHGAMGRDVCDGEPDALTTIAKAKIREGVTTFLPTTLTIAQDALRKIVEMAAPYMASPTFAKAPRLHIEGPYINRNCVGAQNPEFVRPPDAKEIRALHAISPIGIVSLAPETEGGLAFIEEMKSMGIVTSMAHTAATYAQFLAARKAGATHLTHYCNQMTPLHHREIGLVGAALLDDDVRIETICDTIHLCPEMITLTFKHQSINQMMLITDSMPASWMPDGPYELAEMKVQVKNGEARLESGALAGSTLRYHHGLKNVHEITKIPLEELTRASGYNQAQSLGLAGIGEIVPGNPADIVILDDAFEPVAVFVDGEDKLPQAVV
ncbi:MAG: N-acetylglucosamine-6-phosphate deacetylase [Verrucomicrobiales bacterium]|jgi:N-acetylglucosamine-6-phosphate deacetylase